MTPRYDTVATPDVLFRVGRRPDVWQWIDWRFAAPDGTFDGRWDDPQGRYRVLYTSCDRQGALIEALAGFRPDPHVLAGRAEIVQNDDEAPLTLPAGWVPARWRVERLLGSGAPDEARGPLVAVGRTRTLATLRRELAALVLRCGVTDLDGAAIRLTAPRSFTQGVSRFIYERTRRGRPSYAGIFYLSRYGDDVANCALFEREGPFPVTHLERADIESDDPDFLGACRLLGLQPA